jgi:tRNA-dihydrouridine synthase A
MRTKKTRVTGGIGICFLLVGLVVITDSTNAMIRDRNGFVIRSLLQRRVWLRRSNPRLGSVAVLGHLENTSEHSFQSRYNELMKASRLSLAPMMDYTDRHFRHVVRLVSKNTLLYTEMIAANALCQHQRKRLEQQSSSEDFHGDYLQRLLGQGMVAPLEGPSVLQLGGSCPIQMREAGETVWDFIKRGHCNYTALNLNCGCPSPKVAGSGCFGAALMDDPKLVVQLTRALHEGSAGQLPVTVKCRIGTDSNESFTRSLMDPEAEYQKVCHFIETVASDGIVTDFAVHARIAVLRKSFSPAQNRNIPPLKYDVVRRLVRDFPGLTFSLNGGIDTLLQASHELDQCKGLNGVMVGRGWVADPWSFSMADSVIFDSKDSCDEGAADASSMPRNRLELLQQYGRHADEEEQRSDPTKIRRFIVKAVQPLFAGEQNSKRYRIALDKIASIPKELAKQGKSTSGRTSLSELLVEAAVSTLTEETLLRAREESHEWLLFRQRDSLLSPSEMRSQSVLNWQAMRAGQTSAS